MTPPTSAPIAAPAATPPAAPASAPAPANASATSAADVSQTAAQQAVAPPAANDAWPPSTPCIHGWVEAHKKESEAQGTNSTVSLDQVKEWDGCCKQGYTVDKGVPPDA